MNPPTYSRSSRGRMTFAAALPLAFVLVGCVSTGNNSITGFDKITLAPGDTGNCNSSPCQVYLKMPAGTGSYEVTGNEMSVGTFPAGQTAFLGSFWQSQAFAIKGMDAPKTYAYIPVQR